MKKRIAFTLIVSLVLTIVWAGGATETAPEVDLSAPVTLTIWTHDDANRSVFEKELITEFMKENPNVTVDYQTYPSGKMAELLTVAFSAGEGPDIFNQSQSVIRQFVEEDQVSALDPEWIGESSLDAIVNRYIPGSLDLLRQKDVQIVLLDNPDIYSEYAPYNYIENLTDFVEKVISLNKAA